MMRVLFQSRKDLFTHYGGDTLVVKRLIEGLSRYKIAVDVSIDLKPDLDGYDLVHIFGLSRVEEAYYYYKNAKFQGVPVVLSPFHEELEEWDKLGRYGLLRVTSKLDKDKRELVKSSLRTIMNRRSVDVVCTQMRVGYINQQNEVVNGVDKIITWAKGEAMAVKSRYELDFDPEVVMHGVDSFGDGPVEKINSANVEQDYVLCVARIESKKNQLALLESLKDTGLSIILAGSKSKYNPAYVKKVMSLVKKNPQFYYVGRVSQNQKRELMKKARVHILPSWFEILGLANAEAATCQANIVSTDRGYAREYFHNGAWYCDPSKTESIAMAVQSAYKSPKNIEFGKRLIMNFSWEKAVNQIIKIYKGL